MTKTIVTFDFDSTLTTPIYDEEISIEVGTPKEKKIFGFLQKQRLILLDQKSFVVPI